MTQQKVDYAPLWAVRGETEAQTRPTSPNDCVFHQRSGGRPSWDRRGLKTSDVTYSVGCAACPAVSRARVGAERCLPLCDPVGCSPPGSSAHEVPQQGDWSGLPFPLPGSFPAHGR